MDAFEGVFTINIIKSWFQLFAERFGDGVASTIITTLTSAAPVQSLFSNKSLNQLIKKKDFLIMLKLINKDSKIKIF